MRLLSRTANRALTLVIYLLALPETSHLAAYHIRPTKLWFQRV